MSDLPADFAALIFGPTMADTCAYFRRISMSLDEAQVAKAALVLRKLDLQPGMTLLDIGCGWGATLRIAAHNYDVKVIGLTTHRHQYNYSRARLDPRATKGSVDLRLQGWEHFDEPVDRIVCLGAFQTFRRAQYPSFFERAHRVLPRDGRMVLQTVFTQPLDNSVPGGSRITAPDLEFLRFVHKEIFARAQLPLQRDVINFAQAGGFEVEQVQLLRPHYTRTLKTWGYNLAARRDQAIACTSEDVYDRYLRYLTQGANVFRRGVADVGQFTLRRT